MTFKNITVKKRGGGTRKQRVKVLKSGKYKFVKNLRKKRKSRKTRSSNSKRRRSRKVAKRRRRRRNKTIPLAPVLGLAIQIWPAAQRIMEHGTNGVHLAVNELASSFLGWNAQSKRWEFNRFVQGWAPTVTGLLVHKFVGGWPLNFNRTLGRAGVPYIRI